MTEIPNFDPRWPMPETGAELSEIARSLWISKARLAEVISVSKSAVYRETLSRQTKERLAPLLDVYNCAIWMADDEK